MFHLSADYQPSSSRSVVNGWRVPLPSASERNPDVVTTFQNKFQNDVVWKWATLILILVCLGLSAIIAYLAASSPNPVIRRMDPPSVDPKCSDSSCPLMNSPPASPHLALDDIATHSSSALDPSGNIKGRVKRETDLPKAEFAPLIALDSDSSGQQQLVVPQSSDSPTGKLDSSLEVVPEDWRSSTTLRQSPESLLQDSALESDESVEETTMAKVVVEDDEPVMEPTSDSPEALTSPDEHDSMVTETEEEPVSTTTSSTKSQTSEPSETSEGMTMENHFDEEETSESLAAENDSDEEELLELTTLPSEYSSDEDEVMEVDETLQETTAGVDVMVEAMPTLSTIDEVVTEWASLDGMEGERDELLPTTGTTLPAPSPTSSVSSMAPRASTPSTTSSTAASATSGASTVEATSMTAPVESKHQVKAPATKEGLPRKEDVMDVFQKFVKNSRKENVAEDLSPIVRYHHSNLRSDLSKENAEEEEFTIHLSVSKPMLLSNGKQEVEKKLHSLSFKLDASLFSSNDEGTGGGKDDSQKTAFVIKKVPVENPKDRPRPPPSPTESPVSSIDPSKETCLVFVFPGESKPDTNSTPLTRPLRRTQLIPLRTQLLTPSPTGANNTVTAALYGPKPTSHLRTDPNQHLTPLSTQFLTLNY
ncbi:unnamed protein product [Cyprideis torosa]|uniref:Uncharacterized protein n=1 Tax=Cyprideis torosa TaxID=163714 RepID=A0A7R8WGR0_9CRUS|nr:unnamed protein product [Cyprideis torosa]CAG0898502.1 unnamed protein product [Cyprideis torosa]